MSLKSWFDENFGGPESICKTLLKIYNSARSSGMSEEGSLEYTLATRYRIIKTIKQSSFPAILSECSDLGTLALLCILAEQPHRGGKNLMETLDRVGEYFSNHAPEHLDGIAAVRTFLTCYFMASVDKDNNERINILQKIDPGSLPLPTLVNKLISECDKIYGTPIPDKIIIECPECNKRLRVSDLPCIRVHCPHCDSFFEYIKK